MADTDPAATLHALAEHYRGYWYPPGSPHFDEARALADHFEALIAAFDPYSDWPNGRVGRTALAVAAAAGVTP